MYDPRRRDNKPGARPRNNLMLRPVLNGMYPTMTSEPVFPNSQQNIVNNGSELDAEVAPKRRDTDEEPAKGHYAWKINVTFPADAMRSGRASGNAVHYEHASWRKMYLSEPPPTALYLRRRWQSAALPTIENAEGITMGEFVDEASKAKDWDERFIASDRDWHFEGPIEATHYQQIL